ncbi:MAG TPA: hypothetical protein DCM68_03630 [Verrucomicrobia bacterium]|nr:hypothetical protein [Verrucomicrobiota bacterium]
MKGASFWIWTAGWLLSCSLAVQAQIEINWTLAHGRTVLMEPVLATVNIANYSGRDLDLTARGNAKLACDVEDQPTSTVAGTGQPLVRRPVIIPAGETRAVEVNLLAAYRIVEGQSYMLTPVLEFGGMRFFGQRLSLEVQPGIELLRRDFGMPSSGEARTVFLRLIHRDRSDRLFFRIDNPSSGYCLGVFELGRVIRFFVPSLEQDRDGVFHVLHQSGPDRFVHTRFGYDGEPLGAEFYSGQVGGIRLVRDDDGAVAVTGGDAYTEDPETPGLLTAPGLPPSHPYNMSLGESAVPGAAPAGKAPPAPGPVPRVQPSKEKPDAGSEPVTW